MSNPLTVRFTGPLRSLSADARREIVERARTDEDVAVTKVVGQILARVKKEGDAALVALARELDRAELSKLEVPREALEKARDELDPGVRRSLERARANLETVHGAFIPRVIEIESEPGIIVGRRPDPLAAVGVYAPGGRAAYPSSVLMGVVPARVAGVPEIVVCSPPGKNGLPSQVVLAAAAIGGATRVFAIGGAQAIGALAFGTETVPRVDRIVGPGNAYVAEAKRQIAGNVGIDAPAGPSEILVIGDDTANPEHVARELAAQAEHDPEASCVALVIGERLAAQVTEALTRVVVDRGEVVSASLSSRGAVLSIESLEEAWPFATDYAAEHLMLLVREPKVALAKVRHAGTVFLGDGSSVAFGDYMTGANHVLPTAGAGRSFSGLSTLDFVRFTTYQTVTREAAARMAGDVAVLAEAEGLRNHAAAAAAFGGSR